MFCKINRELINDILLKMCEICDYYWDNVCINYHIKCNVSDEGIKRYRQMFEKNLLCFRIRNNEKCNEPSTTNTILSILGGIYAFMLQVENNENIFSDSNFCNTVGICSTFEWKNKVITSKKMIKYYQCCNIDDGQPFISKHWFFNKDDLMEKINDFLMLQL